ncbi:MAG: PIN domain-containing protein [Gaiellaceae bacterium]
MFVDTSALYGALDDTDPHHTELSQSLRELQGEPLLTHNYVVVESVALVRRRFGAQATRLLLLELLAPAEIVWIDATIHHTATSAFLASSARRPSLVDFASFEVMRLHGIRTALAVDRDFVDAGFDVLPA